jgi:polysaccharide pyruvyl transferase WcaK-like protein
VIRVLHLASFRGNLGDAASHMGTRRALERHVGPAEYTELELRRFYRSRGELAFDGSFVDLANRHDLLLVGGGNFFELWVPGSTTGTTVEIDAELMERIRTPIVFYGVGCDDYRGAPPENVERFAWFLQAAYAHPHVLVSVRNDGSRANIARLLGEHYAGMVDVVPDGAFLLPPPVALVPNSYIAVNVALDKIGPAATFDLFARRLAAALDEVLERMDGTVLLFVPHVYSDLEAIGRVLERMDDVHRRERVEAAQYSPDGFGARAAQVLYANALVAIGMRLHANIIPMSQGTPTIGIGTTPKLEQLHREVRSTHHVPSSSVATLPERLGSMELDRRPQYPFVLSAVPFLSRVPALLREGVPA